jgi:hypothetical protein
MRDTEGRLSGHVTLITGAGQGIGRGIALGTAKQGASVVLAKWRWLGGPAHSRPCTAIRRTTSGGPWCPS